MSCVPNHSYVLLLCFILLSLQIITNTEASCHVDDEAGLLAFKSGITADPAGLLSKWIAGADCCEWNGVYCGEERVEALVLYGEASRGGSTLSGTISPALSKLQELNSLFLQNLGNLTGPLPESLFDIPKLQMIYIENTKLAGKIPDKIGKLKGLQILALANNQFSGKIPTSIGNLTQLTYLSFLGNRLQGAIPPVIGQLRSLFYLDLSGNRLSGRIPDIFTGFTELRYLFMHTNKLTGKFPQSISNLSSVLIQLNLGGNSLQGQLPGFLGNLQELQELLLAGNLFSGPVPKSFENLTEVYNLDLSYNRLCGPLPVTNFPASAFKGNACLCGAPLPPCKN